MNDHYPTTREVQLIESAWTCLESITHAMSTVQEIELARIRNLYFQELSHKINLDLSPILAKCLTMKSIREGIEKKLVVGADNDNFHFHLNTAERSYAEEQAYNFGQKLVRWNNLLERRFFDRILNRKGPLEPDRLLIVLNASNTAFCKWYDRHLAHHDKCMNVKDKSDTEEWKTSDDTINDNSNKDDTFRCDSAGWSRDGNCMSHEWRYRGRGLSNRIRIEISIEPSVTSAVVPGSVLRFVHIWLFPRNGYEGSAEIQFRDSASNATTGWLASKAHTFEGKSTLFKIEKKMPLMLFGECLDQETIRNFSFVWAVK